MCRMASTAFDLGHDSQGGHHHTSRDSASVWEWKGDQSLTKTEACRDHVLLEDTCALDDGGGCEGNGIVRDRHCNYAS